MKEKEIYITRHDMQRLRSLIAIYNGNDAPYVEHLEEELERAKIVDSKDIPSDVVTMNSIVRIKDLGSGDEKTLILVFPGKQGASGKAVSILAPIGTALHQFYGMYRFKTGFGGKIFRRNGSWDYPLSEDKYTNFRYLETLGRT